MIEWKPIATAPRYRQVLLYFAEGDRGNPSVACGQNWSDDGEEPVWWGPGGSNSRWDLEMSMGGYEDGPTLWAEVEPSLAGAHTEEPLGS